MRKLLGEIFPILFTYIEIGESVRAEEDGSCSYTLARDGRNKWSKIYTHSHTPSPAPLYTSPDRTSLDYEIDNFTVKISYVADAKSYILRTAPKSNFIRDYRSVKVIK